MALDLAKKRKEAEKAAGIGGGGTFKIKDGPNKIRIIAEPEPHQSEFQGKSVFKWITRVIDRADGEIKLFFMPNSIFKNIEQYSQDEEYKFDAFPMPYDITISAVGAGTKEVKYTVIPAKNEVKLTKAEQDSINGLKPLSEVIDKLNQKAAQNQSFEQKATEEAYAEAVEGIEY